MPPLHNDDHADMARLRATFNKFDTDRSDTIDLSELSDVMQNLGVSMSSQQLSELVQQANVNEHGELEFDAFAQLLGIWREAAKLKLFDSDDAKATSSEKLREALATRLILPDSWGRCMFDAVVVLVAFLHYLIVL